MSGDWIDRPPFLLPQTESPFQLQMRLAAAVCLAAGLCGLLGLFLGIDVLTRGIAASSSMRANTAACLVLAGLSLWLQVRPHAPRSRVSSARVLGLVVHVVGVLTMAEYLLELDLGLDQLLVVGPDDSGPHPGRMAPNTALALAIAGLVLASFDAWRGSSYWLVEVLSLLNFFASFLALCGYAYGAQELTGWADFVSMAFPTSVGILALSVGLLLARPQRGLLAMLAQGNVSGAALRRLLPLFLLTPFILGRLQLEGQRAGRYDADFGVALMVASSTFVLVAVFFVTTSRQGRAELARETVLRDERFLFESGERLRSIDERPRLLVEAARGLGAYLGASRCEFMLGAATPGQTRGEVLQVPLTEGDRPAAMLVLATSPPRPWTPREVTLARAVAQRAWLRAQHLESEERARTSQLRLQALIEASSQVVLSTDPEGQLTEDSPSWRAFTGQSIEQFRSLARREAVHPEDLPRILTAWQVAMKSKAPLQLEYRLRRWDGEWRWVVLRAVPRLGPDGRLIEWVQMLTDVTRHKLDELALRQSEERFKLLAAVAREYATMTLDLEGRITSWNLGAERLFGYEASEIVGLHRRVLYPPEAVLLGDAQLERELEAAKEAASLRHEGWRVRKDGSRFFAEVVLTALRNPDGTLVGFGKVTRDITDVRRAQEEKEALVAQLREANADLERRVRERTEALTAMLTEREVLLREIHHRVKNNLQMISSLLNMQARALPVGDGRSALQDCKRRVEVIGLIHEELYRAHDAARVPFAEHARNLVTNIVQSFASSAAVQVSIDVDPMTLTVDKAIPCGLVLNELVTNALKHAFPDGRAGTLRVELRREPGARVALFVGDDGVGLPPGFDPERSSSLGMRLITSLTRQLEGSLQRVEGRGAGFRITFPSGERP